MNWTETQPGSHNRQPRHWDLRPDPPQSPRFSANFSEMCPSLWITSVPFSEFQDIQAESQPAIITELGDESCIAARVSPIPPTEFSGG